MNTINTSMNGQLAMDGQSLFNTVSSTVQKRKGDSAYSGTLPNGAAEATKNLQEALAETEADVAELQKLSDLIQGHRLQFNVNKDSGQIIIKVVDSSTNELIREIPSEDAQKIQAQMKQAIGLIFDEKI